MLKTSFVNLSLRALTLASKFVLLLFIARFLSPEEMGVWGLMNVTIALSLYFLGMDFYVFNTREILAQDEADRMPLIRDQFVFHGLAYVVILPILTVVFWLELIAWKYIGWFYFLLILEHLSQECSRILITLSRPTMANLVLFFRGGAWIYAVVATTYLKADLRGLPAIWMGWGIGVVFSIILTAWALRRMPWEDSNRISINWAWMRKGVKVSLPFFFATMSFVAIQYMDRYFLQHFWGEAVVGIYTFFASIANTINVFIFTGVIMILYPKIISAYQQGNMIRYQILMRKMSLGIVGGVIVLSALAVLLIDPVLILIDKSVYIDHRHVFFIMLGTTSLLSLSYIPHYSLFVRHRDKTIIVAAIIALFVALIAGAILVPRYSLIGAACATMTAMATIVIIKSIAVFMRDKR